MPSFPLILLVLGLSLVFGQLDEGSRDELSVLNPSFLSIEDFFACKRLFTIDEVIGCGSDEEDEGDFGALLFIEDAEGVDSLEGESEYKRTVLLEPSLLQDQEIVDKLAQNPNVAVILVADSPDPLNSNLAVLDTLFTQPVALLNANDTEIVKSRVLENEARGIDNLFWQHSSDMLFYNGKQNVNSEFCLGIEFCDPLGGQSTWGSVGISPNSGTETILLTIKIDSTALFHDLAIAANEVAAGLAVFLSVTDILSAELANIAALNKRILVAAFQGETFDDVGSKRFIFDVSSNCALNSENFNAEEDICNDFPFYYSTEFNKLDLDDITEIIAISNVGAYFLEESPTVFAHTTAQTALTAELVAQAAVQGLSFEEAVRESLPKSPIDSFVEFGNFAGDATVLTSYPNNAAENNPFIRSRFDKAPPVGQEQNSLSSALIADLAAVVAKTLVVRAANGTDVTAILNNLVVNQASVREIEFCLTEDFSCDLVLNTLGVSREFFLSTFQTFFATNQALESPSPPTFYSSVYRPNLVRTNQVSNPMEFFVRNFVASKISPDAAASFESEDEALDCVNDVQCANLLEENEGEGTFNLAGICNVERTTSALCVASKCVCSTAFFHDAVSPAIVVNADGTFSIGEIADFPNEKVFTEPIFELPTLELFQEGRNFTEIALLGVGSVFTLLTYFLMKCFIKSTANTKYKLL